MHIHFYLSHKRRNSKKEEPIWYRITVNGNKSDKSTGIYINPDLWDSVRKTVKGDSAEVKALNMRLQNIRNQMQVVYLKAESEGKLLTTSDVKLHAVKKATVPTIFDAVSRQVLQAEAQNNLAHNTTRSVKSRKAVIERFLRENKLMSLSVAELKPQLAEKFKTWMKDKKYSSAHTVKCLQLFKAAEYWAVYNEFIPAQRLGQIRVRHEAVRERIFLNEDELKKLEKLDALPDRLQRVWHLFLLQCYTGVAYRDLMDLNKENLKKIRGIFYLQDKRIKSRQTALIPLFEKANAILEYYDWSVPDISNQKYNAYLKEIGKRAGLNKNLTSHSGRFTFGMLMLNVGYTIETVARMMGHSSTKVTERLYAQVQPSRVIQETLDLGLNVMRVAS